MFSRKITILRSSNEEITFAVLTCETETEMSDGQVLRAFKDGLTEWMEETEEGRKAREYSCDDFNIGDFSNYFNRGESHLYLERHGIHNVDVEIHSAEQEASRAWTYDTVLIN